MIDRNNSGLPAVQQTKEVKKLESGEILYKLNTCTGVLEPVYEQIEEKPSQVTNHYHYYASEASQETETGTKNGNKSGDVIFYVVASTVLVLFAVRFIQLGGIN